MQDRVLDWDLHGGPGCGRNARIASAGVRTDARHGTAGQSSRRSAGRARHETGRPRSCSRRQGGLSGRRRESERLPAGEAGHQAGRARIGSGHQDERLTGKDGGGWQSHPSPSGPEAWVTTRMSAHPRCGPQVPVRVASQERGRRQERGRAPVQEGCVMVKPRSPSTLARAEMGGSDTGWKPEG